MNYLMHIYFCTTNPLTLTGACLGDFFKGKIERQPYAKALCQGIQLHRSLDYFADTHPLILQSKSLFPKECRRMAGIALDIFYDHFLAKNWTQYSPLSLEQYTQSFYANATPYLPKLPSEAQYFFNLIKNGDWLTAYRQIENIEQVLKRMSRNIPFTNTLDQTSNVLNEHYATLAQGFSVFMVEARKKLPCNHGQLYSR